MTGTGFQLFPPPPRARQTSPARRPSPGMKPSVPAPVVERKDSANHMEEPIDFHELVIQVNSVPVSPSNMNNAAPAITAPPRVHVAAASGSTTGPTTPSPVVTQEDFYRGPSPSFSTPHAYSPEPNRAVSPAFSTCDTLVRSNTTATRAPISPQEEIQMRSMFPTYNPNLPLAQQAYKPTQASPTHIPSSQVSRLPYSEPYVPYSSTSSRNTMAAKPPPKTFFTPSHLLDNLWLAANGQEEPAIQIYTLKMHRATMANPTITFGTTPSLPFYSLATTNLAGEDAPVQSIINELLIQRHHPTQPRVLPIAQLDLISPPSMDATMFDPQQQESATLLTSIYPKLAALQALDAAANSPAASRIALVDPGAQSPAAQRLAEDVLADAAQRECCTLLWTRNDPKQQANPWAQHIPSEGSYQLHHPTLGTFPVQIEGDCSLINKPSTRPVTAIYGHNMPSALALSGSKPASITLLNPYILSTSTPRTNAFSPLPLPPRFDAQNRPISATPSTMSVAQLPTTTDATADDAMLARLDFSADALTLNLGALSRFGNPFLVDIATSTLLAVAVAEATRGRSSRKTSLQNFDAPPPNDYELTTPETKARSLKDSFARDWEGVDVRDKEGRQKSVVALGSGLRKLVMSLKSTTVDETSQSQATSRATSRARDRNADFDKDIELGEWYGQSKESSVKETKAEKKARKAAEKEDQLPFIARALVGTVVFFFKAVVWVLSVVFKIVAGVVKMVITSFSKS
ncbi:hypothetical protein BU25DRAFT_406938 [Macroventuria anomochaeta]|uniref:Uncharacterized protein n=1 Tax=Macroventuria anomochaeta TaxID=301207 RepID=A0ACB6SDL7_9PLEO|nr:uncharacterized protein BU25DRAFT_406938 [Macroventuria anomochaeta]KAF2632406.1 hypothetical protein BU25DRAFT_406938 [Macroventuria anomochaeta]